MSKARQLADLGNVYDDGALSHRRLTYNGAMNVWQRGTSADTAASGNYMCDRWRIQHNGTDGNVDWDQETSSTPDGFAYALKVSMDASETSLDAGDYVYITQRFEGQDLQHLEKGTANAKKVTLSFWVKSSVASTYTASLTDDDNTRIIGKSYTISTANTWEKKVIVFDGDTSGALDNDANRSLDVDFWIDAGTTFTSGTFSTVWASEVNADRVYDTTGWLESSTPTFYITGVQLEVGDTATPFEHRSYGDELARCQRYYETSYDDGAGTSSDGKCSGTSLDNSNLDAIQGQRFMVAKRASPTIDVTSIQEIDGSGSFTVSSVDHINSYGFLRFRSTGTTTGNTYRYHYEADAEL